MIVTKANLAAYLAGLTPRETPYPIEITETIATDWGNSDISGTVGNILEDTPSGVYVDLSSTVIPNSVTIMQQTFFYCTSIVNAPVIPNSVINMQQTFYGCTSIVNAPVIPNSVTIMLQTFYGCTSIVNAPVIPNSVTNMQQTFYGCTSLENAPVIPNSVAIMRNTFRGCTSLKTIGSFSVDVANCDMTNAFYNCPALEAIYVPAQEVDDWYLLYTDTKAAGTDYYIYDTAGTLLSSGAVAGTNQVLSVYGKSDELVISNTLTPERAIEAATTRLQHHKTGLPYNEESFVLNAKNPDNVICNFLDKYATTAWVKNQGYVLASPSITGSCTTNGTTNNTLALPGIVSALALEAGDVIQITGSTGGLNDKLFTVESITDNNSIIVNYEHAGNRGNGSLKLADQTATVTIKRIAKWYNAPSGLGQDFVNLITMRALRVSYTNTTGRTIYVIASTNEIRNTNTSVHGYVTDVMVADSSTFSPSLVAVANISFSVPAGGIYRVDGGTDDMKRRWVELR